MAHPNLTRLLAPLDRTAVEAERNRLREELADYEALLRLIDRHGAGSDMPDNPATPPTPSADTPPNGNGNGQAAAPRKRDLVLALMQARPGRWTTAEMREAVREHGLDPDVGTQIKNVMWQLAKAKKISAAGNGVYEFPALTESADDPRVKEAMSL